MSGKDALARNKAALELLAECLNDEEPWEVDDLVQRMEDTFEALGGKIDTMAVVPQ